MEIITKSTYYVTHSVTTASYSQQNSMPVFFPSLKKMAHLFTHLAWADSKHDNSKTLACCLLWPTSHYRKPWGCPYTTWLTGIDANIQSANNSIHSAWRKTNDCMLWWHIINIATLQWRKVDIAWLSNWALVDNKNRPAVLTLKLTPKILWDVSGFILLHLICHCQINLTVITHDLI